MKNEVYSRGYVIQVKNIIRQHPPPPTSEPISCRPVITFSVFSSHQDRNTIVHCNCTLNFTQMIKSEAVQVCDKVNQEYFKYLTHF